MKTVEFVVIFSLSIHFACTSNINLVNNEAAVENAFEAGDNPLEPSDKEALEAAVENAVETGDNLLLPSDEEALDTSDFGVEIWDARQCFAGTCNAHCRRLGHARGVCIGNFCQCRLRSSPLASLKQEAAVENAVETGDNLLLPSDEEALDFGVENWDARQCFAGTCNAHCRRLGHARGVCIGNFCQCRLRSSPLASFKQEVVKEIESENRLGCNLLSCLNICTRLGFRYFRCNLNGSCTCWN